MKIKNKVFSLAILMLLHTVATAQEPLLVSPVKIDSLHQLIDNRKRDDEEKVRLLNEYARRCFYNQEYQKGFIATRDARDMSKKLDFTGGEIMYYMTLAALQGGGEMYNFYLQKAESLVIEANDEVSEYNTEPTIPIGYPQNNHEQILGKLTPVLQYFEQLDDKEIQLTIMVQMGWSYLRLDRIKELNTILKKAAELSRDLNQLYPEYLAKRRLMRLLFSEGNVEGAEKIEQELIELLSKGGGDVESGFLQFIQAGNYNRSGQFALAIDYYLKSANAFEATGNMKMLAQSYSFLGWAYETLEMQGKALEIYEKYIALFKNLNDTVKLHNAYNRPVYPLYELKRYDEARRYMALALQGANEWDKVLLEAKSNSLEGQIRLDQGAYGEAIPYLQNTYETYSKLDNDESARFTISFTLLYMARCYQKMGDMNNALKSALECLERENQLNYNRTIVKSKISFLISEIYIEMGQPEKAFEYVTMYQEIITASNKVQNANSIAEAEIRSIIDKSEQEIERVEKEREEAAQQNRIQRLWIVSITGALLSAIVLAIVLYRNFKNKKKANILLREQKEEIESTLEKLESTQSQLIQSEKMASLGELTAGIAHEIQNPLNFVNNFSEVNSELLEELKAEGSRLKANLPKGSDLGEMEQILKDLEENEHKIKHHGQRADSIVKGMLQHSRSNDGQKEPTDINALADEYLRLAYHGLRAKDKSFNAAFSTELDENLPKINVIPQDIGRALLNLINNAFQAVSSKASHPSPKATDGNEATEDSNYKPNVSLTTKLISPSGGGRGEEFEKVQISIKDNGPGIPDNIKEKIFQPFFTTKPTGSGTGLGLSLSYDIVKAHGGELMVETKEGDGSEFILQLPVN